MSLKSKSKFGLLVFPGATAAEVSSLKSNTVIYGLSLGPTTVHVKAPVFTTPLFLIPVENYCAVIVFYVVVKKHQFVSEVSFSFLSNLYIMQ